ncbi:hypothetical protein CN639_09655 [Bacillus toyonensis]|nr:hypothetical protein CN616_25500 [Bacillus toyonensis]PEM91177.1 hypothetical protein CN639_09655 [Bacillus toyonensis]PFZ71433.1 hypothetical protein COL82_28800 [Bacillus toyonensis]PGA41781.1 hypothetical protein COL85_25320 [Bacillus toyonensis]PGB27274.1 hypothetical protein COM06_11425 [Bacillus toyonensis]
MKIFENKVKEIIDDLEYLFRNGEEKDMKIGTSEWLSLSKDIKLKLIRLAVIDSKYKQAK